MKELGKEAQEWLAKHAVLLGPEELPFEEEKLEEAMRARDGSWPVPCAVPHMGVFADIMDEDSFNSIVGDPANWPILLERTDLYHAWVVPQAIVIFGRKWFNSKQWGESMRPGPPPSLFDSDDRRAARKAGTSMADTPVGKSVIFRIMARVEHALDVYLSGGGRTPTGTKKPGGYIVRSVANEFIQDASADMGYRLVRVRACPNCLATRKGRSRRSEVTHVRDNIYSCERCADAARNIALAMTRNGAHVSAALVAEHERAVRFSEFSGMACVCPNSVCRGRFVPIDAIEDVSWWLTDVGRIAREAIPKMRALKGIQRFRTPPEELMALPLRCPFCSERFTPASALAAKSGFHGHSGKLTGLPSVLVWVRTLDRMRPNSGLEADLTKLRGGLVDGSNVDPAQRIAAKQRVEFLVGELAAHAQDSGVETAPALVSRCFYEAAADWMISYPEDASRYFFDWTLVDKEGAKKTTAVARGQETAIHQTILGMWLERIAGRMRDIRKAKGSRMRSIEDLKWFCRPPVYNGGPRVLFTATVDGGLRIPNESRLVAVGKVVDRPRMAWVVSIRKVGQDGTAGEELRRHMRTCEWQTIRMTEESGLRPGDQVKVSVLMMPGHHCHAPIQRIIRLRTTLLSPMIDRIRSEEAGEASDASFWREWHKRTETAKKATGIGIR